jgi:hypothetical protein
MWAAAAAALAAGLTGACARQGAPPGGPEDRRPPVVVGTYPDTFATLTEPFRGPVRFDFDERISERVSGGSLDDAVVVSPRTGEVRVRHGRQSISVELDGGFRPGVVYRVTLLPVVGDLFNNQLLAPFDLVFSTGAAFNASAVAGTVWDRTTAESVDALQVLAIPMEGADSTPFVARTDTGGVYVFRYLPPRTYRLVAFQDRNRDGMVSPMELQGESSVRVPGADTLFADIPVLQPDTTPARLTRAVVVDSLTVLVEFDDYLDPVSDVASAGVRLTREDPEGAVPLRVLHEREYVAWVAQLQDSFSRLDSVAAAQRAEDALEDVPLSGDTLAADSAVVAPPPGPPAARPQAHPIPPALPQSTAGGSAGGARRAPSGEATGEPLTPDGRPLPSRRIVVRLDDFLVLNAAYQLTVQNATNVNGLSGGGGESAVVREPPPDTAVVDSLALSDSLAPDTLAPDTLAPDTLAPDTLRTPPDTSGSRALSAASRRLPFLPARRW